MHGHRLPPAPATPVSSANFSRVNLERLWPLLPLAALGGWCLVVWLIARIGGWHALAWDFRAAGRPREGAFSYVNTGSVGWLGHYRGCLIVGVTPAGLYLAVWPMFRPGHPPLLIPWTAVRRAESQKVFWSQSLLLAIAARPGQLEQSVQL